MHFLLYPIQCRYINTIPDLLHLQSDLNSKQIGGETVNNEKDIYSCTIKFINGIKHYYVTFSDINKTMHTVEINYDMYVEFRASIAKEKSHDYYFGRYIEHLSISDEELHKRSFNSPDLTDEQVINKQYHNILYRSINDLPEIQRRRFILYYEYEMTYKQIAKTEDCSTMSVKRSIDRAKKTIIKILKKF